MEIKLIASKFPYGLKMMSKNTLSEPQPDSASYSLYSFLHQINNPAFINDPLYFAGLVSIAQQFPVSDNVRVRVVATAGGAVSSGVPTGTEVNIARDLDIEDLHKHF